MPDTKYINYIQALEEKTFKRLLIKRHKNECFLLIDIDGKFHVFVNQSGNKMIFRHIWQIKELLEQKYKIATNDIPIEII